MGIFLYIWQETEFEPLSTIVMHPLSQRGAESSSLLPRYLLGYALELEPRLKERSRLSFKSGTVSPVYANRRDVPVIASL